MDKDSFARAVEAAGDMLYRVAFSILRNNDDCKDALQEAALKAWIKRGSLRDEARFQTWLTRILINECRNIQRRRKRLVPLEELPEQSAPPPDPGLWMALQALPDRLRLPLVLRYAEGMSEEEAASALGITRGAVRGRVHRAKIQLRKELEE